MNNPKPESLGIPSKVLSDLINRLDSFQIPMHSILISRYNQLAMEAYYAPYDAKSLHRMFSVSKSFTSLAIGLLADEDKLNLDDPICHYFPEFCPAAPHPYMTMLTIRHMLKMETCHATTTYKHNAELNWVESFFTTPPTHRPGSVFRYDTSASHTLCALVEKLSGMGLLDYLKHKLQDKLILSNDAYMIKDPFGTSMGGTGLMATPMDLMNFASFVMGEINCTTEYNTDKSQHTSFLRSYLYEATSCQSHTLIHGPIPEERVGYGYQFWRIRNNGFACYGMGGQFAICLPDYDLIMVTTADTQGMQGANQLIYNALYDLLLPYISDTPLAENSQASHSLNEQISSLAISPVENAFLSPIASFINKSAYKLSDNPHNFTSLSVQFIDNSEHLSDKDPGVTGELSFFMNDINYLLPFGLGHMIQSRFPIYGQNCVTSGEWLDDHTLYIKSHITDEAIGSVQFQLSFADNHVSVFMKKIIETDFCEFDGFLEGTTSWNP